LHWSVVYTVIKVLKCKCRKWPRMSHLDIFNISYGQKKGRESNWQFDSRPLKVGNRSTPMCAVGVQHTLGKLSRRATTLLQNSSRSEVWAKSYDIAKSQESKPGQYRDSTLGVPGQKAIWAWVRQSNAENTIWGKVVVSPESGPCWIQWVQGCPWLVPTLVMAFFILHIKIL
jgi:hypothetical protein